ncbi:MAG: UDP-3-O-(3-hydroxymyristoyl)glucosamine N-acyltransferase [Deltaproteobacteria bacterium]|nr:UDP-3-O-(3-hydroxymyristoyl)glucosamine N-acyltransferase [Deltaproteobacteria bacterium]
METTLGDLQRMVGGELHGDPELRISGVAPLESASAGDISFVISPKYSSAARSSKAAAFVVPRGMEDFQKPRVVHGNPYLALAKILALFSHDVVQAAGVSSAAHLDPGVKLGKDVSVHPGVYVGEAAVLGDRVILLPGVYIGAGVHIGEDCLIYPNATILERCRLGKRVIVHSGTVIGSDGFGYAQEDGRHVKIPHLGIVQIDDDVEIGANCTVDRGTLGRTWIKRGVKIDNLVQIAHNVVIGENSIIVAQVGISGSTRLGKHVVLAGQVGVAGHLEIGDGVRVGGQSGVAKSIAPGETVSGSPAIRHQDWLRNCGIMKRLPDLYREMRELEQRLNHIEQIVGARGKGLE